MHSPRTPHRGNFWREFTAAASAPVITYTSTYAFDRKGLLVYSGPARMQQKQLRVIAPVQVKEPQLFWAIGDAWAALDDSICAHLVQDCAVTR